MSKLDQFIKTIMVTGLLSLVPVLMPSDNSGSETVENRTLTTLSDVTDAPVSEKGNTINHYVEDNVKGRQTAKEIAAETAMNMLGISSNDDVIVGREGWFFLTDSVRWHTGEISASPQDIGIICNKLSKLSEDLSRNGARLVLFVAPDKETVYQEFLPETVAVSHENTRRVIDGLSTSGIEVIYPADLLNSYKSNYQLYAKRDTHWMSAGAYIASRLLVRELGSDNPPIESLTMYPKECVLKDLSVLLGIWDLYEPETDYDYSGYGLGRSMPSIYAWGDYGDGKSVHTDGAAPFSVYILRDSFFNYMEPFVTIAFEESFIRHFDNYVPGEILSKGTDIVLIEVCERSLMRLKDIEY